MEYAVRLSNESGKNVVPIKQPVYSGKQSIQVGRKLRRRRVVQLLLRLTPCVRGLRCVVLCCCAQSVVVSRANGTRECRCWTLNWQWSTNIRHFPPLACT